MNQLSSTKRAEVVRCLVEGCSVRSTVRMTGVAKNTIVKLLVGLGEACAVFHEETVRNLGSRVVQVDEVWVVRGLKGQKHERR